MTTLTLSIDYNERYYEGSPDIPTRTTCATHRYNIRLFITDTAHTTINSVEIIIPQPGFIDTIDGDMRVL